MVSKFVFEHPKASVPITEYVVVTLGETVTLDPIEPLLQEYVEAPLTNNVEENPEQIEKELAEIVNRGTAFTVTELIAMFVDKQPNELVPITL
jgi:hypothetical protein